MGNLLYCQPDVQNLLQGMCPYPDANSLILTIDQLNSVGLAKNILRVLPASLADMPPLEAFPKSHVVTFKYYCGVVSFLEEDYGSVRHYCTPPPPHYSNSGSNISP